MTASISGDTGITFPDNSTQPKSGYGPAFSAYQSVAQSLTSTASKLLFQMKEYDTANAFDSTTNYRFQPAVAGYYQLASSVQVLGSTTGLQLSVYKNSASYKNLNYFAATGFSVLVSGGCQVYLNGSTDYAEIWAASGTTLNTNNIAANTYFQGIFIRGA